MAPEARADRMAADRVPSCSRGCFNISLACGFGAMLVTWIYKFAFCGCIFVGELRSRRQGCLKCITMWHCLWPFVVVGKRIWFANSVQAAPIQAKTWDKTTQDKLNHLQYSSVFYSKIFDLHGSLTSSITSMWDDSSLQIFTNRLHERKNVNIFKPLRHKSSPTRDMHQTM